MIVLQGVVFVVQQYLGCRAIKLLLCEVPGKVLRLVDAPKVLRASPAVWVKVLRRHAWVGRDLQHQLHRPPVNIWVPDLMDSDFDCLCYVQSALSIHPERIVCCLELVPHVFVQHRDQPIKLCANVHLDAMDQRQLRHISCENLSLLQIRELCPSLARVVGGARDVERLPLQHLQSLGFGLYPPVGRRIEPVLLILRKLKLVLHNVEPIVGHPGSEVAQLGVRSVGVDLRQRVEPLWISRVLRAVGKELSIVVCHVADCHPRAPHFGYRELEVREHGGPDISAALKRRLRAG
mmetsp:Transcript_39705/g.112646  ORF Transcript_39705/g.112646 Transcript_39705/m.112646 type:complete len:292 (+) Transcript_39705:517-1392(+)